MRVYKHRGDWWVDYRSKGRGGRKKIGKNKQRALEVMAKLQSEMIDREWFPARYSGSKSFGLFLDKFWNLHGSTRRSARSWSYVHREILERFGQKAIASITTADVQAFYNEAKARTCSTSANKRLTWMKLAFNRARKWADFHGQNPCNDVVKEADRNYDWRCLEREEMDRLIPVAHPRLYPVLMCALLTGMRRGEILHLAWQDVSLKQGSIRLLITKSGKRRDVPIPAKLHRVFMDLGPKPEGSVFNLPNISLRKYWVRAKSQAAIKGRCRFHDLRHTFASWFMRRGGNIYTLQKILGHSTIKMTERYAHLAQGHLASEMALLESVIPSLPNAGANSDLAPIWHQPSAPKEEPVQVHIVKSR